MNTQNTKKIPPSMDTWLKEAKQHESAPQIGMYLTHNGVVRATAKAQVRHGEKGTRPVTGMLFSYDEEKVSTVLAETKKMDGIYYVRRNSVYNPSRKGRKLYYEHCNRN